MATDPYLRVVLTVIAIALLLIAMNPWISPRAATAQSQQPVPVYTVNGPYGLFTYAKVGTDGALRVETP